MRTVFIHGEVDLFASARDNLVERFTKWGADQGTGTAPALAELLLDDKFARDGLLARWTEPDLEQFLVEVVPRKVVLAGGWLDVPAFLHAWLDFLQQTGLLMNGPLHDLHAAVDRVTPAYLKAMAEPTEWSGEKFWTVTMREHGVDIEDEQAVDAFFDAIAEDEITIDDALADAIEDRDAGEPSDEYAYWLPPVLSPAAEELEQVEDSAILATMRAVVTWARPGRSLTEDGTVRNSDMDELATAAGGDAAHAELCLEWAKLAGLVRVADSAVVATHISTGLLEQPGFLWTRLWQTFVLLDDVLGADELDEEALPKLVQEALNALYSHGEPVPAEVIIDLAAATFAEEAAEDPRPAVGALLSRIFRLWESMDAVRSFVTDDREHLATIDGVVPEGSTPDHTMVELRPAGVNAARGSLETFGFTAPTVDDLVPYPAEVVTLALDTAREDVLEPAATGWIEHRGRTAACAELATLLGKVDDPGIRLTALWLTDHAGAEGDAAVHGLIDDPVAGSAARMWLQSRETTREVAVRPDDELLFSLDAMTVAAGEDAELFVAEFRQQSTSEQVAMIDRIPQVRHCGAGSVLETIADQHPDEEVASAAQRSLDKVRTA